MVRKSKMIDHDREEVKILPPDGEKTIRMTVRRFPVLSYKPFRLVFLEIPAVPWDRTDEHYSFPDILEIAFPGWREMKSCAFTIERDPYGHIAEHIGFNIYVNENGNLELK